MKQTEIIPIGLGNRYKYMNRNISKNSMANVIRLVQKFSYSVLENPFNTIPFFFITGFERKKFQSMMAL